MRGHIKKRATWQFVVDLGPQPLQHCPVCVGLHVHGMYTTTLYFS